MIQEDTGVRLLWIFADVISADTNLDSYWLPLPLMNEINFPIFSRLILEYFQFDQKWTTEIAPL